MCNLTKVIGSIVLGCLCILLLSVPCASAASLWSDPGPGMSIYSDRRAHAVGDIITIIISENSNASRGGKADNSKSTDTNVDMEVGIFGRILGFFGIGTPAKVTADSTNSDTFQAKGSISNTNNVNARMTAQVTEVKPNGNFLIAGTQSIQQNGEEQKITISGIVRAEDISTNNTVLSSSIGDAKIQIDGKGPIANKQKQGIISQFFNIFF